MGTEEKWSPKKMKCADVAKDLVCLGNHFRNYDDAMEFWKEKFKACEDFPKKKFDMSVTVFSRGEDSISSNLNCGDNDNLYVSISGKRVKDNTFQISIKEL